MASSSRRSTTVNLGGKIEATIVESSEEEYDVFLNFRGEDTRKNIVDHLWLSLREAQIKVFMDESSLRSGEEIEGELLAAIERSKIAITIISEDYASSAYCLKELAHILECKELGRLMVIPIFYKVNPSDIRRLMNSFQRIRSHAIEYDGTIFQIWKNALTRVGHMKGLVVDDTSYEGRTVRSIVEMVKNQLTNPCMINFNQRPQRKRDTNYLVGIDEHAGKIIGVISKYSNSVLTVGICGMGGIGKTTLAKYMYDQFKGSFEFCNFVTRARHSLSGELSVDQLISIILEQGSGIANNSSKGMSRTEQFLYNKKIFIALDDTDSSIEVSLLMRMCSYCKSGSIIMFITRNRYALIPPGVKLIFELPALSDAQSMQFFSHHAFGRDFPPDECVDLTKSVVIKLAGLPLLLKVIGSSLFGKEIVEWESTLKKLESIPHQYVQEKLQLCYEALDENEKQLFCVIAFFPNGFNKQSLFLELDTTDIKALDTLEAMSLVKFDIDNKLYMHDLLRDLGRKIHQDKSANYHSGLWSNQPRRMLKASKLQEDLESRPLAVEVFGTPTQLDEPSCFLKTFQTERNRRTTTRKQPIVVLEEPWLRQHEFAESTEASKTGCKSMESEVSSSQPIADLDRLFDEINSMYTMEEKLPSSNQEAISLVDSFIKQINFPDTADIDFTSPNFLQALESLRQPNALHEVPTELLMAFHSALTSFAGTPEYLDQIQSAKTTFSKCTRVRMAKEDEIQQLKFELDMDKIALRKTQGEIKLLEAKLALSKTNERDLETKLINAIPTVRALCDDLKRCKDQLLEAQAQFDNIPTFEEHIRTNHHRVKDLLYEIKNLFTRKSVN